MTFRAVHGVHQYGGARRDRTADPLLAKQVLSQLSYGPLQQWQSSRSPLTLVGLGRVELPTSPLSGVRSNQLSYRPAAGTLRTKQFVVDAHAEIPSFTLERR